VLKKKLAVSQAKKKSAPVNAPSSLRVKATEKAKRPVVCVRTADKTIDNDKSPDLNPDASLAAGLLSSSSLDPSFALI
jgi:hypothetical protein